MNHNEAACSEKAPCDHQLRVGHCCSSVKDTAAAVSATLAPSARTVGTCRTHPADTAQQHNRHREGLAQTKGSSQVMDVNTRTRCRNSRLCQYIGITITTITIITQKNTPHPATQRGGNTQGSDLNHEVTGGTATLPAPNCNHANHTRHTMLSDMHYRSMLGLQASPWFSPAYQGFVSKPSHPPARPHPHTVFPDGQGRYWQAVWVCCEGSMACNMSLCLRQRTAGGFSAGAGFHKCGAAGRGCVACSSCWQQAHLRPFTFPHVLGAHPGCLSHTQTKLCTNRLMRKPTNALSQRSAPHHECTQACPPLLCVVHS